VQKNETHPPPCPYSTDTGAYARLMQYHPLFPAKEEEIRLDIIWKAGEYSWKPRCKAQQAAPSWDPLY